MRLNARPRAVAKLRAISVLPRPGKSSNSTWPPARPVAMTISSSGRFPTTARSTSATTFLLSAETSSTLVTGLLHLRLEIVGDLVRVYVQRRFRRRLEAIPWAGKIDERVVQSRVEVSFHGRVCRGEPPARPGALIEPASDPAETI